MENPSVTDIRRAFSVIDRDLNPHRAWITFVGNNSYLILFVSIASLRLQRRDNFIQSIRFLGANNTANHHSQTAQV